MGSHWTPVGVSLLCILLILGAAGGTVLQTRLFDLAKARQDASSSVPGLLATSPEELEFTLAPEAIRDLSMDDARAFNAALPFSTLPIQPAPRFIIPPANLEDYARALDCLTAAVYFEAASETGPGQAAVAQVVLNRMRHPAFPKTVCGVVFQGQERATGCQFSFTCDGAMARIPSASGWARARAVASAALNGFVSTEVGMATHYHTDWVAPYWAESLVKIHQIGTHIFYRWTGAWGLPSAFRGGYAGSEPIIAKMAPLASNLMTTEPVVPVFEEETLSLGADEQTPLVVLPLEPVAVPEPVATDAPAAPVAQPAAPPPPVSVLANPMDRTSAPSTQRRRLAVPR